MQIFYHLKIDSLNKSRNPDCGSLVLTHPHPQDESTVERQQILEHQSIGHVTITYIDPHSNRSLTTEPVPFELVRASHPSADLLQVNRTLDCQRNRVETANALERAMAEPNFGRSRAILKAQVEKIKRSITAAEPFCQQLIQDLEYSYPSEQDYRSSHHNTYMSHWTERGTYVPMSTTSSEQYGTAQQRRMAAHIRQKYFS